MNIEWNGDLEIGVEAIDNDHKAIVEFYNIIFKHYNSGANEVYVERAIEDFRFMLTHHLLKEENFMMEINYPDFESHAREHEAVAVLLNAFSQGRAGPDESCEKIAFLVLQWISSHLEGADRRLARFVKNRAAAIGPG